MLKKYNWNRIVYYTATRPDGRVETIKEDDSIPKGPGLEWNKCLLQGTSLAFKSFGEALYHLYTIWIRDSVLHRTEHKSAGVKLYLEGWGKC